MILDTGSHLLAARCDYNQMRAIADNDRRKLRAKRRGQIPMGRAFPKGRTFHKGRTKRKGQTKRRHWISGASRPQHQ